MRRYIAAYLPVLAWAGCVLYVGGRSRIPGLPIDLPVDKVAHFFMYGVLGALAARAWQRTVGRRGWWWPLFVILSLAGWDEWRQRPLSGRSADVADWSADAAGAILAFAVVSWLMGKARGRAGDES